MLCSYVGSYSFGAANLRGARDRRVPDDAWNLFLALISGVCHNARRVELGWGGVFNGPGGRAGNPPDEEESALSSVHPRSKRKLKTKQLVDDR